jgi:prepilin-type N-terminal cleavage/methylation domain-containing protein
LKSRGFSLIEITIAVAIFGLFIIVLVSLEMQFIHFDRSARLEFFTHPEPLAVTARLRKDVLDSNGYPESYGTYTQTSSTLILSAPRDGAAADVIVYDFTKGGEAVRHQFRGGEEIETWTAHNVPKFRVDSFDLPRGRTAVRIYGFDRRGSLSIDQIVTPRAE